MTTYPNKLRFYHFNPAPEQITLADMAQATSMVCRYNGMVPYHYSVAYHEILCLRYLLKICPRASKLLQRTMFTHDCAEAYWPDMHSMAKRKIPVYMKWLQAAEKIIADKYDTIYPEPDIIKHVDSVMLSTELVKLKGERPHQAEPDLSITFRRRTPESVRKEWLAIWDTIKPRRKVE